MSQEPKVIDPELLAMLVCPIDHGQLELKDSTLVCTTCGRVFPIVEGIPNMVVEE
ncbi:MAG: Trm112 family protein [Thermomicrobiales bacterium]|nr:Trm112 family protein [Thermomicrobiales bacterium]